MQYAFNNALIMSRRHKMDRAFRKCLKRKEKIVADYQNCRSCYRPMHIHTWGPRLTHSIAKKSLTTRRIRHIFPISLRKTIIE